MKFPNLFKILFTLSICFALNFGCGDGNNDSNESDEQIVAENEQQIDRATLFSEGDSTLSQNGIYTVKAKWRIGPSVGEANSVEIIIANELRAATSSVTKFEFLPFMTIHGHPGAVKKMTIDAIEGKSYHYLAQNFYFTMSGDWELLITAEVNGKKDKAVIKVQVP